MTERVLRVTIGWPRRASVHAGLLFAWRRPGGLMPWYGVIVEADTRHATMTFERVGPVGWWCRRVRNAWRGLVDGWSVVEFRA